MDNLTTINSDAQEVKLTNVERVLWPEEGYTKGDLLEYYAAVFPYISPHLKNRPLVFNRYPKGIKEKSFYQKNAPKYLPEWIDTFAWVGSSGNIKNYILVKAPPDLIWLANQACIEIHPWLSQIKTIHNPDFVVFDLDPAPENSYQEIVIVARLVKNLFDKLGLRGYLKTSGSMGLHIYLPLLNRYTYSEVRDFGQAIGQLICQVVPDIATINRSIEDRGNRIYIDYLQNGLGKTVCAPYSVRPRSKATVSTPLKWEELEIIHPEMFTIKTLPERLTGMGDLFKEVLTDRQELEPAKSILGLK